MINSLRKNSNSFKRTIVDKETQNPLRNGEGLVIMGLKHFLLNPDILEF